MTGIFYADIFVINGKGCVIMGSGKSKTCRNYTGEGTVEIVTDSIRLEYDNNELIGYGDVTMGFLPFDKEKTPKATIAYLIYMQGEGEGDNKEILTVTKEEFCELAARNIEYALREEGMKQFVESISQADITCISVPWCDSMETKGALIAAKVK